MVLDAAASTSGGMLSLSANVDERGASASSSRCRALVLGCGAGAVQQDHMKPHAARQSSVWPCMQARAVQVRCRCTIAVTPCGQGSRPGDRHAAQRPTQVGPWWLQVGMVSLPGWGGRWVLRKLLK